MVPLLDIFGFYFPCFKDPKHHNINISGQYVIDVSESQLSLDSVSAVVFSDLIHFLSHNTIISICHVIVCFAWKRDIANKIV